MAWIWPRMPSYFRSSVSFPFSRPEVYSVTDIPHGAESSSDPVCASSSRRDWILFSIRRSLTARSWISLRSSCSLFGWIISANVLSSGSRVSKKRVSNSPVLTAFLFPGGPVPPCPSAFLFPGCPPFFFATLRLFFCNVALSHLYLFFQLRIVPTGIPSF